MCSIVMKAALDADLAKLKPRAYRRAAWAQPTLRRYHETAPQLGGATARRMRALYEWMFVPPTIWPFHVQDVLADCLSQLEKRKQLSPRQRLLIELLPPPPDDTICNSVAEHEHAVQQGTYEHLVKTPEKYRQNELAISTDPELRRQWSRIKAAFDVTRYCDHKGVIRRTMSAERNMRPAFTVNSGRADDLFRAAFDAFCLRWNLYGVQGDTPLLLKLAVNLTPSGTMILIPAYWSFDPKRDIRWSAVARLHRARVSGRQGAALAEGVEERMQSAKKLRTLEIEARRLGLKGAKKHEFLCNGLGWVAETSPKRISRLRTEFEGRTL